MSTFAEDIESAAGGEDIVAIIIGKFGWGSANEPDEEAYGWSERPRGTPVKRGVRLDWSEARPMLDYTYDDGFGAPDCHYFTAWTRTRVLTLHEYDGATSIMSLPRNPPHKRKA